MDIKQIEYIKRDRFISSSLTLEFMNVHFIIVNTLRRVSMDCIPTYAFCPDTITISENTSIAFNNDYMRLRLSQLPIFNIDLDTFELPEEYQKTTKDRIKHPDERNIDIYINSINLTGDVVNITTNDIGCQLDDTDFTMYDKKFPILLIKLKPEEKFKCHLHAILGIGQMSSLWSASVNSFYEIKDDNVTLTLESSGQLTEYDILTKSCQYIIKKFNNLNDKFKNIKDTDVILELENEDMTVGNLLNHFLQNHKDIIFSGVSKPDLLQKVIVLKIKGKVSFENIIKDVIKEIINTYENIQHMLEKLTSSSNKITKLKSKKK